MYIYISSNLAWVEPGPFLRDIERASIAVASIRVRFVSTNELMNSRTGKTAMLEDKRVMEIPCKHSSKHEQGTVILVILLSYEAEPLGSCNLESNGRRG